LEFSRGNLLNINSKELLIFDFDGTLIDSVPDLAMAVNDMLTQLEKETFSEDIIRSWVGNGAQTLVQRALEGNTDALQITQTAEFVNALDIFLASYDKNICEETKVYPHVITTLTTLKQMDYTMAIVTNKPQKFIEPILESLQMESFFDYFIGGDALPEKKPHPTPLLHVCNIFGIDREDAVMVGDSKNDILAAKAAGMHSIGVTYGYNYGENIQDYKPDATVDEFNEILDILSK